MTPDIRTNTIIVSAPARSIALIEELIKRLDVAPSSRAEINIFPLKKADAQTMAATLQQLFLGTSSIPANSGVTGQVGFGQGQGGAQGGIPGLGTQGGFPGTTGLLGGQGTGALRPLVLTLGGVNPEGAPLIDLRVSVDTRTNSVIVAGSRNDLEVAEAVIAKLEDSDTPCAATRSTGCGTARRRTSRRR